MTLRHLFGDRRPIGIELELLRNGWVGWGWGPRGLNKNKDTIEVVSFGV